jgi:microcystin-dependent protein
VNSDFSDIADAITGSLSRTGQGGMTSALGLSLSGFFYTSDPDTGMNRSAANTQVISCGGQDWTFTSTDVTAPDGSSLLAMIGEAKIWCLPNAPSGYVFLFGQACTTTYPLWRAALIAAGNPFGTSGGDPLFPDFRCLVPAGKGNMGGVDRGLLTGSTVLGSAIGSELASISVAQLPVHTPAGSISTITPAGSVTTTITNGTNAAIIQGGGTQWGGGPIGVGANLVASSTFTGTPVTPTFSGTSIGSGQNHANVQPTIVINYIARAA